MQQSSSAPQFGSVVDVGSQARFLEEVDLVDARAFVVVHLYDPDIRVRPSPLPEDWLTCRARAACCSIGTSSCSPPSTSGASFCG